MPVFDRGPAAGRGLALEVEAHHSNYSRGRRRFVNMLFRVSWNENRGVGRTEIKVSARPTRFTSLSPFPLRKRCCPRARRRPLEPAMSMSRSRIHLELHLTAAWGLRKTSGGRFGEDPGWMSGGPGVETGPGLGHSTRRCRPALGPLGTAGSPSARATRDGRPRQRSTCCRRSGDLPRSRLPRSVLRGARIGGRPRWPRA